MRELMCDTHSFFYWTKTFGNTYMKRITRSTNTSSDMVERVLIDSHTSVLGLSCNINRCKHNYFFLRIMATVLAHKATIVVQNIVIATSVWPRYIAYIPANRTPRITITQTTSHVILIQKCVLSLFSVISWENDCSFSAIVKILSHAPGRTILYFSNSLAIGIGQEWLISCLLIWTFVWPGFQFQLFHWTPCSCSIPLRALRMAFSVFQLIVMHSVGNKAPYLCPITSYFVSIFSESSNLMLLWS